jgi:hypothetical protein
VTARRKVGLVLLVLAFANLAIYGAKAMWSA